MKRMLVATSIATLALIGVPAAASADAACFGGIHKAINTQGALGLDNVGQLVKEIGGQAKNDAARGLCAAG